MKRARAHIGFKTKLCATLCQMLRPDEAGRLVPVIPYAEAKVLTEDQVLARFHFDHDPIPHAEGGPDVHWNLTPRPVAEHREITAKIDIPGIAKRKRQSKDQEELRRILTKPCGQKRQKSGKIPARVNAWPKRPFKRGSIVEAARER